MSEVNSNRFRYPKEEEEVNVLLSNSTPKSTQYKTKWAFQIFKSWQTSRVLKYPSLEVGNAFRDYELNKVQAVDEELKEMSAISLNYWLSKFVQEVANKNGGRYPSRTLYQIACGIKRYLEEQNGGEALNPLDNSDKRFFIFRRVLDSEMKDASRQGIHVATKKPEKEAVSDDDEKLFWSKELLGSKTATILLHTIYYYNGKLFGLRGSEHRNLTLDNFELGPNFIRYEENVSKTFHGGLRDLKYTPKSIKHFCHEINEEHEPCLLELYRLYIGLVQIQGKGSSAFYFRPSKTKFRFEKSVMGIHTLDKILPSMCKEAGINMKTSHSLRVSCATKLFNAGVPEKMIRERTGHRSSALFNYEKPSEDQCKEVSKVLGVQSTTSSTCTISSSNESNVELESNEKECIGIFEGNTFNNCKVNFYCNEK